ncbi:excalibur calcium-binding domain-containing protein [Lysobacter koreensis]|uniref:Excalibur calcium-binding domain-containing protein n=1 Tax=Lysobacter koreensis TaxID=266122 RepID=A0ABW2YPS3_9GAMM
MKVKDLFWFVVFGGAALFAYDKYSPNAADAADAAAPQVAPPNVAVQAVAAEDRSWIKPRSPFASATSESSSNCDGRTSCPQMTSCAEAKYFIQHCPNTAMDGDRDGIPCEDQWCR